MSDKYEPDRIMNRYNPLGEDEWERLEASVHGKVSFLNHMRYFNELVKDNDSILETGAGSGRFTVELLKMGAKVTVFDLSPGQLETNEIKVKELGLEGGIIGRVQGDICDLSRFESESFDCVVCYGGPLSYVFEKRIIAMDEMLRVLKPGGYLFLSVMSLIGTIRKYFGLTVEWTLEHGVADWNELTMEKELVGKFDSGDHWLKFFTWSDLKDLLSTYNCKIVGRSASNCLSNHSEDLFEKVQQNEEFWNAFLTTEIKYCKEEGNIDSGTHIIAVVQKGLQ